MPNEPHPEIYRDGGILNGFWNDVSFFCGLGGGTVPPEVCGTLGGGVSGGGCGVPIWKMSLRLEPAHTLGPEPTNA